MRVRFYFFLCCEQGLHFPSCFQHSGKRWPEFLRSFCFLLWQCAPGPQQPASAGSCLGPWNAEWHQVSVSVPRPLPGAAPAAELNPPSCAGRSFFPLSACSATSHQAPAQHTPSKAVSCPLSGTPVPSSLIAPPQGTSTSLPGMCGEDAPAERGVAWTRHSCCCRRHRRCGSEARDQCNCSQVMQRPLCRLEWPGTGVGTSSGGAAVCPAGNLPSFTSSLFSFHTLHTPQRKESPPPLVRHSLSEKHLPSHHGRHSFFRKSSQPA